MSLRSMLSAALLGLATAAPNPRGVVARQATATTPPSTTATGSGACASASTWLLPTQQQWNQTGTDQFLQQWMTSNQKQIAQYAQTGGFVSAFTNWALGEPQVTCKMDGSTDCNFDTPCDNQQFQTLGSDSEQAYFVLQGVQHLHAYFAGLQTAYEEAALLGALQTDDWVETFYTQPDGKNGDDTSKGISGLLQVMNALTTVFSVAMAFIAPETLPEIAISDAALGIGTGVAGVVFGGAMSAGTIAITHAPGGNNPDNFQTAADVGSAIGSVVQNALTTLSNNNDILMSGGTIQSTGTNGSATVNIGNFLQGGAFVNASINEADAMSGINTMLTSMAINQMWRQNKIFILGGGACGDNQGIGSGPNETWCDPATNTAWYLYFWEADSSSVVLNHHKYGWVTAPPGSDQLGQGAYANISVADVIQSSVRAYSVAGYNYTTNVATERLADAVANGWANPMAEGAAWEGLFTIPVCNVSAAINSNIYHKEWILEPYDNMEARLQWCGPICNGDLEETKLFINASLMENFDSPKAYCNSDPGYSSLS